MHFEGENAVDVVYEDNMNDLWLCHFLLLIFYRHNSLLYVVFFCQVIDGSSLSSG